jgi:hypothetical protein
MERKIVLTQDGSHTLYLPDIQESYHSIHGAIQESKHVYINAALLLILPFFSEIRLLEVGFGTGLNALLTLLSNNTQKIIYYCGIEAFPITYRAQNDPSIPSPPFFVENHITINHLHIFCRKSFTKRFVQNE